MWSVINIIIKVMFPVVPFQELSRVVVKNLQDHVIVYVSSPARRLFSDVTMFPNLSN